MAYYKEGEVRPVARIIIRILNGSENKWGLAVDVIHLKDLEKTYGDSYISKIREFKKILEEKTDFLDNSLWSNSMRFGSNSKDALNSIKKLHID